MRRSPPRPRLALPKVGRIQARICPRPDYQTHSTRALLRFIWFRHVQLASVWILLGAGQAMVGGTYAIAATTAEVIQNKIDRERALIDTPSPSFLPPNQQSHSRFSTDVDLDQDDIPNARDNCPSVYNPDQTNTTGTNVGDACKFAALARIEMKPAITILQHSQRRPVRWRVVIRNLGPQVADEIRIQIHLSSKIQLERVANNSGLAWTQKGEVLTTTRKRLGVSQKEIINVIVRTPCAPTTRQDPTVASLEVSAKTPGGTIIFSRSALQLRTVKKSSPYACPSL